jgi:TolB-like protein
MKIMSMVLALCAAAPLARAESKPTVAILYFDYSGKDDQLGVLRKGLAQMLISDLSSQDSVRIVERDRLEAILAELKLGQSAKIDPSSAAKVGKLLGARYMVLGGYFDLMSTLRVDARVVEVETGKVVQSVGANGKPDDFLSVEQKVSEDLSKILGKLTVAATTPAPTPTPNAPPKKHVAPPAQLKTKTALLYSKALVAMDKGDKATAKTTLQAVVKEQPDFKLASLDLDKMMQ